MIEAATRGVVDFGDADPGDKRWWFRLRLVLDHLEAEGIARQHRLYYDYSLAILSRGDLTEESGRKFTKDAETKLFALVNMWRPWEEHDPEDGQRAQADALATAWAREYGDPNAPETQRAIAETIRMLEKMNTRARKPANGPTLLG
jgi:hypothetical protein